MRLELSRAEALLRLSRALVGKTDLQATLEGTTCEVAHSLPADLVGVALIDEGGDTFSVRAGFGWPAEVLDRAQRIPLAYDSPISHAIRTRRPVPVADFASQRRHPCPPWADRLRAVSALVAPMLVAGEAIGALVAHSRARRAWSATEARHLSLAANCVAEAIARMRWEGAFTRSEERFRLIVENVHEIIYRVRAKDSHGGGSLEFISTQVESLLGYRAEEFLQDPDLWRRVIHPEDLPGVIENTQAAVRGRSAGVRQYRVRHKATGEYLWLADRVVPLLDDAGRVVGWQGAARDRTEQVRVERERERLLEQLQAGRARVRMVSQRLLEVQERERRHIARELHDEIGQALTGLRLLLEAATDRPAGSDEQTSRLRQAQGVVSRIMTQVHDLSLELRPPMLDDLGLLLSLLWYFEQYTAQTGVHVTLEHRGLQDRRFEPGVETAAYRIVQEALTNVARHASTTEATVGLWATPAMLTLQVEDRGTGFDPGAVWRAPASLGLPGMRERAELLGGCLAVESAPGGGTRLTAELPLRDRALTAG